MKNIIMVILLVISSLGFVGCTSVNNKPKDSVIVTTLPKLNRDYLNNSVKAIHKYEGKKVKYLGIVGNVSRSKNGQVSVILSEPNSSNIDSLCVVFDPETLTDQQVLKFNDGDMITVIGILNFDENIVYRITLNHSIIEKSSLNSFSNLLNTIN